MQLKDAQFVIYVKDIERSKKFYEAVFQSKASIEKPEFVEVPINQSLKLGMVNESEIVKVLGTKVPHPMIANGIPRNEIYLLIDNPEEVFNRAIEAGAECISEFTKQPWGHRVAYVIDFDGNVIAFAKE